jgi:hypothetical protein
LTPQLVKRVHELYEQLGRDEVQAVEDLEKAQQQAGPASQMRRRARDATGKPE